MVRLDLVHFRSWPVVEASASFDVSVYYIPLAACLALVLDVCILRTSVVSRYLVYARNCTARIDVHIRIMIHLDSHSASKRKLHPSTKLSRAMKSPQGSIPRGCE